MAKVEKKYKTDDYVYDIQLDGTVVNALGMNVVSNTDGFNFKKPSVFRYTEEHPYISNGKGRNSEEGKAYTLVDADVAEFEDTYMYEAFNGGVNKNGLGVDEYCTATINFSRKNYADLLDNGKIKLVGNSIKSKKMPIYIEKFLNVAIDLLLHGKGAEFLEQYYDYIEKIYNLKIPLKDIASNGKIKTTIESYKENCKQLTANGGKKARQAWYELAIKHDLHPNMGDAIYYINTGTKKSESDVKRITKYFIIDENGERVDMTKVYEKEYNKLTKGVSPKPFKLGEYVKKEHAAAQEEDILIFNCVLLPSEIVEDEDDHFCTSDFEYNTQKYIDQFNKKVKPLLVCFAKSVRTRINEKGKEVDNILITNPKDRKVFTAEESQLVSGEPYNTKDEDTYEQLMTLEDKEIKFWLSVNKKPPYIEECGMNWDEIVKEYNDRQEMFKSDGIQQEIKQYNEVISKITPDDVDDFIENGTIPADLLKIVDEDINSFNFLSKKWNVPIGSIYDIIDKDFSIETVDETTTSALGE